ncbi:MAG: radical SAM protein [Clostridium argentinense]|uniref:radical SAM/SPASM domain-containing protein n=1 Tax=uncultured Clostridium sp. TaxID=59620 RepID=UPI001DC73328|nr:radical SAM protein [uncultured Clostridium sp.]MBS5824331.1 radical SAM protein [Clostridium argentinense]MDU1350683.1 radical SAM protein [Clostridium argentinense]
MNSHTYSNMVENLLSLVQENNTLFSATIELLTKCNWKCKHCYIPNHNSDGLSTDTVFDIFEQLRTLGTFEIVLTGGEIFCRNDIVNIIEKARQMFFKVTLLTNVSLMDEDIIFRLSKLHLYNISCTIFSLDENIHDSITGIPGSLKKALNNIMLIKKYGLPLEIKTVIMKQNYNSHKELQTFCDNNGFQYSATPTVSSKNNGDNFPQKFRLSQEQLEKVFLSIDNINNINSRRLSQNDYVCNTIRSSLFIGHNGDVYPCNTFNIPVGNIYKTSIGEIWNDSDTLSNIRNIRWSDLKECVGCSNMKYCYKCPGISLLEDGSVLSKSSLACAHANIRHKLYYKKGEER